ncbi:MAG: DUF4184 family protein [Nitrososphaera sp.]|uniref:DUF4184 family protein n=1 Tax=Nitrososphaera sp. TaxID=1971748 RepID=UPI003D6E49D1
MTLTPLHVAFVWILKPGLGKLSFAALTMGAVIPDLEPLVAWMLGWSVFCGWDFPCTLAPDRLVLHSIVGALTADVALTVIFVKVIQLLKPERIGIRGFAGARVNGYFLLSAAIGSLSHVFVDWLHHPANPVFWPFLIDSSYYVDGLLLSFLDVLPASLIVAAISCATMFYVIRKALVESGEKLALVFSNPARALSLVTGSLSKNG